MIKKVKKYKSTRDFKEDYYNQLVRPDGTPISTDEGILLNLVTHWTKTKPVATSTYEWILEKKFSRLNHIKSIKRKFKNISLYIKCKFEQKQIIDGEVHYNKLRIERVADFDAKIAQAKRKEIEQQCPHLRTQMSTPAEQNVHTSPPSMPEVTRASEPPIKITIKNTINDNHDYQHNQFFYSNFFRGTEYVETGRIKVNNYKLGKVSVNGLAKEECKVTSQTKKQATEFVEAPIASDYVLGDTTVKTETKKRTATPPISTKAIETVGKDGNTYQSPYLRDFRFTERMIDTAISRSNKPHYTHERVWVIIRNILEKRPDALIYGGRSGAINYLVKAIDGERDYEYEYKYPPSKEERAQSMAEREDAEQVELAKRYELLFQGKIKSISQAENYYG